MARDDRAGEGHERASGGDAPRFHGEFRAAFNAFQRLLALAKPDDRLGLYAANVEPQLARPARLLGVPPAEWIAAALEVAEAHGLIAAHGRERIEAIVQAAAAATVAVEPDLRVVQNMAGVVEFKLRPVWERSDFEATAGALAGCFAELHKEGLRYVAPFGKWLMWRKGVWETDEEQVTMRRAIEFAEMVHGARRAKKERAKLGTAAVITNTEKLARALLPATVGQWDCDPRLLNGPEGTVMLDRCEVRPHRREDYCTKKTRVSPASEGGCPRWLQFLDKICDHNGELVAFLQRVAGYCATGLTEEQCLFFLYGTGQNGKGTFCRTLQRVFGDYATQASIDTFTAGAFERHPEELASLRGARLVIASETDEGKLWSEAKIKTLTGGDTIRARFMRMDSFVYVPQFKLVIQGNHKPALRSADKAMRRRMVLIPFMVEISDAERDDTIEDQLAEEGAAILQWVIEGAKQWHMQGLDPPAFVRDASAEYIEDEDTLGQWLEERTRLEPSALTPFAELFASWKEWAEQRNEWVGTSKAFTQALKARGFMPVKSGKRYIRGLIIDWAGRVPGDTR
jgi:putative DNA primase/helicase